MASNVEAAWRYCAARGWSVDVGLVTASRKDNPQHSGLFYVHLFRGGFGISAPQHEYRVYRPTLDMAFADALNAAVDFDERGGARRAS